MLDVIKGFEVRVWEKLSFCTTCHHFVRVLECKLDWRSLS